MRMSSINLTLLLFFNFDLLQLSMQTYRMKKNNFLNRKNKNIHKNLKMLLQQKRSQNYRPGQPRPNKYKNLLSNSHNHMIHQMNLWLIRISMTSNNLRLFHLQSIKQPHLKVQLKSQNWIRIKEMRATQKVCHINLHK